MFDKLVRNSINYYIKSRTNYSINHSMFEFRSETEMEAWNRVREIERKQHTTVRGLQWVRCSTRCTRRGRACSASGQPGGGSRPVATGTGCGAAGGGASQRRGQGLRARPRGAPATSGRRAPHLKATRAGQQGPRESKAEGGGRRRDVGRAAEPRGVTGLPLRWSG